MGQLRSAIRSTELESKYALYNELIPLCDIFFWLWLFQLKANPRYTTYKENVSGLGYMWGRDRARLSHEHMHSAKTSLTGNETRARVSLSLDERIVLTLDAVYKATTHSHKAVPSTLASVCLRESISYDIRSIKMSAMLCRGQAQFRAYMALSRRSTLLQRPLSMQRLPYVIRPSAEEVKSKKLSEMNLEIAVRGVHLDGLVVVEGVVPHEQLDRLNTKMVEDARILQARGKNGPFNYNVGNIQQDAPPCAEHFYPSILTSCVTPIEV